MLGCLDLAVSCHCLLMRLVWIELWTPYFVICDWNSNIYKSRACISMGSVGAWHPQNFGTWQQAPTDFENHNTTNNTCRAPYYGTDGTNSVKFLTQALIHPTFFFQIKCQIISHLKTMRNFDQCAPNFRLGIDEAPRAWRPAGVVAAATPHRRQRLHSARDV